MVSVYIFLVTKSLETIIPKIDLSSDVHFQIHNKNEDLKK